MTDLCNHIKLQRRENFTHVTSLLCPHGGDPLSSREAKATLWQKRHALATRIDMCTSQALGCAVSAVKSVVAFATQLGGLYMDTLVRSLKEGFLVGFQSYLSTQGDELGMLEDLDCAALWLDTVTVRLVTLTAAPFAYPPGHFDSVDEFSYNARTVAINHLMQHNHHTKDGQKIAVGSCEGLSIRRGVVSG